MKTTQENDFHPVSRIHHTLAVTVLSLWVSLPCVSIASPGCEGVVLWVSLLWVSIVSPGCEGVELWVSLLCITGRPSKHRALSQPLMQQGWGVARDPAALTSSQVRLLPLGSCILRTRCPLTQGVVWGGGGLPLN